ncbi:MAG: M28 family peptidase [Gammaproteobacteria bacterium]
MRKLLPLTALLCACSTPPMPSQSLDTESTIIRSEAFRAHVHFLASDLLEGREAGTRGYDLAAHYVATQFDLMGLTPAGADDGFFQTVPLRAAWRDPAAMALTIAHGTTSQTLTFKDDYLLRNSATTTSSRVDSDAVFVGFGIDAPGRQHNDYAGLDVSGKTAVVLSGFPTGWPSEEGAFFSSGSHKLKTAEANGAVAVLFVYTDAMETVAPWARMTQNTDAVSMSWLQSDGVPRTAAPGIRLGGILSPDAAAYLFEGAPKTYAEVRAEAVAGTPQGFALIQSVQLRAGSRFEDRHSANVAGMVMGTDPKLRDEYVVITAHLDHLGIGTPVDGDTIYNGALDNAAGIAAMLEAARALQLDPPRRSVLFLAVNAEEKALLGSEYFAFNPTVPIDAIIANVNLDMPVLLYDFEDLIGFGADHSSLSDTLRSTLADMNLGLAPDPFPEQAIFVRTDHFRFVQQGIPAISLATGRGIDANDANTFSSLIGFIRTHYHQPSDDLSRPIHYAAGARFAEVNYRLLKSIADADTAPRWNTGDFFGDRFGR